MERLLEMALKVSDQVEVYSIQETKNTVSFENSQLKNMAVSIQSGLSLRIVKNGRLGFAYTKNLIDRNGVLNGALSSLKGGAEAPGGFPGTQTVRGDRRPQGADASCRPRDCLSETPWRA